MSNESSRDARDGVSPDQLGRSTGDEHAHRDAPKATLMFARGIGSTVVPLDPPAPLAPETSPDAAAAPPTRQSEMTLRFTELPLGRRVPMAPSREAPPKSTVVFGSNVLPEPRPAERPDGDPPSRPRMQSFVYGKREDPEATERASVSASGEVAVPAELQPARAATSEVRGGPKRTMPLPAAFLQPKLFRVQGDPVAPRRRRLGPKLARLFVMLTVAGGTAFSLLHFHVVERVLPLLHLR